jgi:hypothetical protein
MVNRIRGQCLIASFGTRTGKPIVIVDLGLHVGEVLYGNVGAVDRLDFTVIGPAVNEVHRNAVRTARPQGPGFGRARLGRRRRNAA